MRIKSAFLESFTFFVVVFLNKSVNLTNFRQCKEENPHILSFKMHSCPSGGDGGKQREGTQVQGLQAGLCVGWPFDSWRGNGEGRRMGGFFSLLWE